MSPRNDGYSPVLVAAAVVLVALAAVAPVLVDARPANEIPVRELPEEGESLSDPTGDSWSQAPSKTVELASAPSGAPNADDISFESASVRAAHTDERMYVKLSWEDETVDDEVPAVSPGDPPTNNFTDAVALQFPVNASTDPGIAMGSSRTPVNVWYWNAQTGGEELLAGGPGTTTPLSGSTVETNAAYEDGRWHVTFGRDLAGSDDRRTDLRVDRDVSVAVAVWDGSNGERAGRKAVSDWQYFPLGPGPRGPPYATILWVVAGLAVLLVIVATATGLRRT